MPAHILREGHRQHRRQRKPGRPPKARGGTDDVKKAYRRMPVDEVFVIAVYDPARCETALLIVPGFIFGAVSAVLGWNRYPALLTTVSVRFLALAIAAYYDDLFSFAFDFEVVFSPDGHFVHSPQLCLGRLVGPGCINLGFSEEKHVPLAPIFTFLGVVNDWTRAHVSGVARIGASESRKESLAALAEQLLLSGVITKSDAQSFYGKARFTACPVFGRVGLAALQPISAVASRPAKRLLSGAFSSSGVSMSIEVAECLSFLQFFARQLPMADFPLEPILEPPVVVLTDASYSSARQVVGVVVVVPASGGRSAPTYHYTYGHVPDWILRLFESFSARRTYICQAELLAMLVPYLTFPDILEGRPVHHLVDNVAAFSGAVKAASNLPDSARLIHHLHLAVFSIACRPWFGFVYSEDNLSDLPSRLEFDLMLELGAQYRACRFPSSLDWAAPAADLASA